MTLGGTDSPAGWQTLALSWLWAGALGAAALLPCPDCGRQVSPRALMCPQCGCRGDVIEQAAKELAVQASLTGSVLKVDFGCRSGMALPVKMNGGRYAVFALDEALGGDGFQLFDGSRRVGWQMPEVAENAPLVRLRIQDTNLVYWTVGGGFCQGGAAPARTNQVAVWASSLPKGTNTYRLDGQSWRPVQPREMGHLKTLERIRRGAHEELPYRSHPYFKKLEASWRKEGDE